MQTEPMNSPLSVSPSDEVGDRTRRRKYILRIPSPLVYRRSYEARRVIDLIDDYIHCTVNGRLTKKEQLSSSNLLRILHGLV